MTNGDDGMTLEEARRTAPRLTLFGETQFIVGTPDNCELITLHGAGGSWVQTVNDKPVLLSRGWSGTAYANDQQGEWMGRDERE